MALIKNKEILNNMKKERSKMSEIKITWFGHAMFLLKTQISN